jgi:putative flippase GtrA
MNDGMTGLAKRVFTPGGGTVWQIQFLQHVVTGAVATAAHYVVMWLCLSAYLLPALSTSIGFIAGAATRFLFSYFHIFMPARVVARALPHFAMALVLQMAFNAALLTLFLSAALPVWPAQLLTTGLLTVFNFLTYKFWVFR